MMNTITPYSGYDDYTFAMSYDEVKTLLRERKNLMTIEQWPNKGCDPEIPWDILRTKDGVSFFFAKGTMFKIYFEDGFQGSLFNGITLRMPIKAAVQTDPSLRYDDWEEDYISDSGYWLEDDPETGEIISITVFIREVEDDDIFFKYEWCSPH